MTSTENREPKGSEHSSTDCVVAWHTHTGGPLDRSLDTCRYDEPEPTETENEVNAHQHIRIGLALLVEDREHWHSRDDIAAFLKAELEHAFKEAA